MYFGIYLIASRHRQFDGQPGIQPHEPARRASGMFVSLLAWLRRILH